MRDDEWRDADRADDPGRSPPPGDDDRGFEHVAVDPDDPITNGDDPRSPAEHGADGDEEYGGNVAGDLVGPEETLEPGSPSVEAAVFVILGATVTTLLFLAFAGVI